MRFAISGTADNKDYSTAFLSDITHCILDRLVNRTVNMHIFVKFIKLLPALDRLPGALAQPS